MRGVAFWQQLQEMQSLYRFAAQEPKIEPGEENALDCNFSPPDAGTFWFSPVHDVSRLREMGLYGVLAFVVARRTKEIGLRMALGAGRGAVIWMVMRETLVLVVVGVAIGIPVAMAATRLISSILFGLKPSDPVALLLSTLAILTVAMLAGYLPGRRASSVDPMMTLRSE